jgi:hypothetical protein
MAYSNGVTQLRLAYVSGECKAMTSSLYDEEQTTIKAFAKDDDYCLFEFNADEFKEKYGTCFLTGFYEERWPSRNYRSARYLPGPNRAAFEMRGMGFVRYSCHHI